MGFFRRLFNNSDEQPEETIGDKKQAEQATSPAPEILGRLEDDTLPVAPEGMSDITDQVPLALNDSGVTAKLSDFPLGVTRPLSGDMHFPTITHRSHLTYGQASDVGMIRNNNQDAALTFYFASDSADDIPDFGVFVVADGMGGHKEGEKASALTAKTVLSELFKTIYLPILNADAMNERVPITEALVNCIKKANDLVRQKVQDGGTTVTALVLVGEQAYIGHVGDSRAYLIRQDGTIEQITRDHSVVQRLIELDQITPEEAETHEQRNVLYRAVGQNADVDVDILRRRMVSNSSILLCSDGLWGLMENREISAIVNSTPDAREACEKLVALANTYGGTDNITAVLLRIPSN